MEVSDENFREAFKPIQIPAHYRDAISDREKVIYGLAQMGHATASAVVKYLLKADPDLKAELLNKSVDPMLNKLFDRGLINGEEIDGELVFDLSKITQSNDGAVNPDLLAPGLD